MKRLSIFYLIIALFAVGGLLACGGGDDDEADKPTQPAKPVGEAPKQDEIDPKLDEIDFKAEAAAIRDVQAKHAAAIGKKDVDDIMSYWLENNDVFTAWTFWAGAFEKTVGWDDIKKAWPGIFRLRGGQMTVEITSIAIDSRAANAVIEAKYKWAVSGDLISMLQKDRKDTWKISAIDYTNGKFGKQVKKLNKPAYQE